MSDPSQQTATGTATGTDPVPPEWPQIAEAGGIHNWVQADLRRRGLIEEVDTASLSDKQRKAFRARRDEERRVRKLLYAQAWAAYKRAHLVHVGVGVFYHDVADYDRFDIAEPEQRRQENDLPALADTTALAEALELPIPRLRWLVYHREVDRHTHYHRWTVPKRSGGERLISAPKPELKRAQRWIARNITEHLPVHGAAHGFLPGRSTATNAAVHAGARVIIKFDIRDFYPSVTLPRVKGVFRKAGYGEQVATVMALLCTEPPREEMVLRDKKYYVAVGPRSLPQGAPTSPSITNALALGLDSRLAGLARSLACRYTRYADDLTFSWHGDSEAPIQRLKNAVARIVHGEGFRVHEGKTRIMRAGGRQKVTGLVVNAAAGEGAMPPARVPRDVVRRVRAAIHNRERGKPGGEETLEQLRGWAAYIYMTNPERGRQFLERLDALADDGSSS
ncbi:reverse transcriptase family protein [Haliangium ochraceum]|uniref:RNA-directed DNA polymerase n=1 Tax=Haliangium ochraceum (strain DSM 14365 / JCM 11303 / SMP-2) TaxID=502025 RepID=D0LVY5_HALO1|nr:reverse transcriptase family protein [Haliangium ochraceum]ACY14119.1 RNA-directed DNA polymerase (Reverse transcriptase) [Haliangium ochraceum DSM 14365]